MKSAAVICLLVAFCSHSLGEKDTICSLPAGANGIGATTCLAAIPSWSYYPEDNACKEFTYGGCGGNDNRFDSQSDCEAKCMN